MWLWSTGHGYFEGAVDCFLDTVYVDNSPICNLALFQGISFWRLRLFPTQLSWDGVYILLCFLYVNIGISADLPLEISNLCSLHQSSIICSVFCSVLNISGREGPCIIIIMSLAKTTIFKSGVLESSAIRSLMMMFHKVGPDTGPCGQPLVARLELTELPNI